MLPSQSLFRKFLSPFMWCRNYHPLPEDKPEESLNDAERWDSSTALFYSLVHLLHFAFVVIAVYMVLDSVILMISLGFRHARSANFPLTLRNWKPQAHRSIFTCCFPQRNHDEHPAFPRFIVSRVRLRKCPAHNPTKSIRSGP